jgi:hypothetical protein
VRDFGSTILVAVNLLGFANTLARAGDPDTAARLLGCAEAHRCEADIAYPPSMARELLDPTLESARNALGEKMFAEAWEQGLHLTADDAVELALNRPYATSG